MFTYALPGEHTRPPKDVAMHCKKSKFQTECMYALTISNDVRTSSLAFCTITFDRNVHLIFITTIQL